MRSNAFKIVLLLRAFSWPRSPGNNIGLRLRSSVRFCIRSTACVDNGTMCGVVLSAAVDGCCRTYHWRRDRLSKAASMLGLRGFSPPFPACSSIHAAGIKALLRRTLLRAVTRSGGVPAKRPSGRTSPGHRSCARQSVVEVWPRFEPTRAIAHGSNGERPIPPARRCRRHASLRACVTRTSRTSRSGPQLLQSRFGWRVDHVRTSA